MTSDPRAKAALDAEWDSYVFSSVHIPQKASGPGTRVMSVKLRLSGRKRSATARQFTLPESLNFVMKKEVN